MRTLQPTQAWISICLLAVVSSATVGHAPSHHDASEHGHTTTQKRPPDSIIPFGVQIPDHVLSARDIACISADNNIFQIMNEAQKACNGTDMRCTFYHFVNHEYQKIGTLDIDKALFDDLLMKFDNWLLTAENIDKDTDSIHVDNRYKQLGKDLNSVKAHSVDSTQIKSDHTTKSDDVRIHSHHIKNLDATHHKNHNHKWKNGNHVQLDAEYNDKHQYFEVFLPKDETTGKPRTIYVEIDRDKNEFVLLDEDIDKKLNGVKPIKIKLDELSEIADTAFNYIVKSVHHKGHHTHKYINDDDRATTSDFNTFTPIDHIETHLDIGADELIQNILNPSGCNSNICNINANQQLISSNTTGNVTKILDFSTNLLIPNKYINQAQYHVESQICNITNTIPDSHFEILQNTNENDIHETAVYENEPFDTIEFDNKSITDVYIIDENENENANFTEHHEISADSENTTYKGHNFTIHIDNNDISNDIDNTHDFTSPDGMFLKEPIFKDEENKLKSTPDIYEKPKSISSLASDISDYIGSQLDLPPSENRQEHTNLEDHTLVPSISIPPYTTVPIMCEGFSKEIEMDSHLQSSSPASGSQNSFLNSNCQNPTVTFHHSPLDSEPKLLTPCAVKPLSFDNVSSQKDGVFIQSSREFIPCKDSVSLQSIPTQSSGVQLPSFTTSPFHLDANTPVSQNHVILPTNLYLPNSFNAFDTIPSTRPLTVMSYSPINRVNPLSPSVPILSHLRPKDNIEFINAPFDNNLKETMIQCSCNPNKNRYSCDTIPYILNPHQFIQPHQSVLSGTSLQPTLTIPTQYSSPISVDQNKPCLNADYPLQTIPLVPFKPKTPISPLNLSWVGSSFIPNTCPNIWNNIPLQTVTSLPHSIVPTQYIWNYPSPLNYYLGLSTENQPPTKESAKFALEDHSAKNILEVTPTCYTPFSSVYSRPMDINPSIALERDLKALSYKYGIPLTKILDSLETEIVDTYSKTGLSCVELPFSKFPHNTSLKNKSTSSATNTVVNDEARSCNEEVLLESDLTHLTPLDANLIGPHLEIENTNSDLLGSNDYQTHTIASETTGPPNAQNLNVKNLPITIFKDKSLIGSNQVADEERIENADFQLQSDSSSMMPLDSSLIGQHLELERLPGILESNIGHGTIVTSPNDVQGTSSSQIKTKLAHQNRPANLLLDSSLKGPHLPALSPDKPLLSDEIQNINYMIPLESNFTELTPLDSSHIETLDEQSEILQHENTAVTLSTASNRTNLHQFENKANLIKGELHLESDYSGLIPLDASVVATHLLTESSQIYEGTPLSFNPIIIQSTHVDGNELDSTGVPSSLLPTLLKKAAKPNLNLNIHTHDTQLNKELNDLSLGSNLGIPLVDISSIAPSLNSEVSGTVFKMLEPSLETADSIQFKHQLTSPKMVHIVDSFQNIDSEEMSSNLDLSLKLDDSLIGPSLLKERDSHEVSPILNPVGILPSSINAVITNPNKNPLTISNDSGMEYDMSLTVPTSYKENQSHRSPNSSDFVTQVDTSSVIPNFHERIGSSATSSILDSNNQHLSIKDQRFNLETEAMYESRSGSNNILDSSLVGPHLSTAPVSNDEIKLIQKKLQLQSDVAPVKPLASSLIGPHLDVERQHYESEISRYQNTELSELVEGELPIQTNAMPSVYSSDLQELLSKFNNAVTKSHLAPYDMKPYDRLLTSISKMTSNTKRPYEDLQTYTFSPSSSQDEEASQFPLMTLSDSKQVCLSEESVIQAPHNGHLNYYPTPVTFPKYAHAGEAPQILNIPYSSFVQMNPWKFHNWQGSPLNIHNILQTSTGFRPIAENGPNTSIEQMYETSNIPLFIESVANPLVVKEYLQQSFSKPYFEYSPIVLPSSTLDAMLQLPTVSNELTNVPCQSPVLNLTPISSLYSTPSAYALASPILSDHTRPYAKPISSLHSTCLPLDLSYVASPFTASLLPINPCVTRPLIPEFSNGITSESTEPSDYPSAVPLKPSYTYSSPYLPVLPRPVPTDTSSDSPFINNVTQAMTSSYLPAYSIPKSVPYLRPKPKSLPNYGLPVCSDLVMPVPANSVEPTPNIISSSAYLGSNPSFRYSPIQTTPNTLKPTSHVLSQNYLTPKSQEISNIPSNIRYLPLNTISSSYPQRPMNSSPISYVNNLVPNAHQILPVNPNIPTSSYNTHEPTLSPYSQIKHNIPYGDIQCNLKSSPLTVEVPSFNTLDENIGTYTNPEDIYYHETYLNYPLESMSYTLSPEKITETLPEEALIEKEELITVAPITNLGTQQSLQTKVYKNLHPIPYNLVYGKPSKCPFQELTLPPSLVEQNQKNMVDNPQKYPASQPISILSTNRPLLKPLTSTPNLINPYNMLPITKDPLSSSPNYSTVSQNMLTTSTDPRLLEDITSPAFSEIPINTPCMPLLTITSTKSEPPKVSYIPRAGILKSSSMPTYNQYVLASTLQDVTSLSPNQNFKNTIKPPLTFSHMLSILPTSTTLQDIIPLYETPIHDEPYMPPQTALPSSSKDKFINLPVISKYTVSPSFNNAVKPLSRGKPQTFSFTPQYYLPAPLSSTVPISTIPISTYLPLNTPQTANQALTNHIIPSSPFKILNTDLRTALPKKLSNLDNIPRYDLPFPNFVEPTQAVPCETEYRPLENTVLKPYKQLCSYQPKVSQTSPICFPQPTNSYPAQPTSNTQYTTQFHPKLWPLSTQYVTAFSTPKYPLPLKIEPNTLINKPLYSVSKEIYDTPIQTLSSARNPFLNPGSKPQCIPEVPSYSVPNNLIVTPKQASFDSTLLLNRKPAHISQNPLESYTQITSRPPLPSLSLLKPLAKPLLQKSSQYQPEIIPINSLYLSPDESMPQLVPATSPLLQSPLITPLLTNSQNNAPLLPVHLSRLYPALPKNTPKNYLNHGPSTSLPSEIPVTAEKINLLPPIPSSLLKTQFTHLQETPVTTVNMPTYDALEPSRGPSKVTSPLSIPSLIPQNVKLIDTTNFLPLSQTKSEALVAEFSPKDRPIHKNTASAEADISDFFPYTTLLNAKATSPINQQLPPKLQASSYSTPIPPLFLSPQEYKELIQRPPSSEASCASSNYLKSTNNKADPLSSLPSGRPHSVPLYTNPISITAPQLLQSPILTKSLSPYENSARVTPGKGNILTLLNKYVPYNKNIPLGDNSYYPFEQISSVPQIPCEAIDSNEYGTETIPYDIKSENIDADKKTPYGIEAELFTESFPELKKGLNVPICKEHRPQRLSKLDHFFANNHIGQSPQVFTVPTYKTLPTDIACSSNSISPEMFNDFNNILTGDVTKLDTCYQTRPNEYYSDIENCPKNVPVTNFNPQTYLNPYSKPYSQKGFIPNAMEFADISEMPYQPVTCASHKNINDIKYSGYKMYQIPSLISPKLTQNLGIPHQITDPTIVTYSPPFASRSSKNQQNPMTSQFYRPTEISELDNTQFKKLEDVSPLLETKVGLNILQESPEIEEYSPEIDKYQTSSIIMKSGLNNLQKSPELDEYSKMENVPVDVVNFDEDNELKTTLINYINNRDDVKNNLSNNNVELTIPIGNIAITKKEPYDAKTIETNNPSVGLKVWKSNVKIAQAEIKLKFKDLSVNNFMPVVNNLDKYDMEEIRKIVKNYIDEKYGPHIEVNEPYTIDNKYAVLRDFEHSAMNNKYNLLWPTNYL